MARPGWKVGGPTAFLVAVVVAAISTVPVAAGATTDGVGGRHPTMVYQVRDPDTGLAGGLRLMDLVDGQTRQVTDPTANGRWAWDHDPTVNPDGRRIAYVRSSTDPGEVRLVDIVSGDDVVVEVLADHPTWSPDGRLLAYDRYDGEHHQVVVRPVVGLTLGPARVVFEHDNPLYYPAWSPFGDRLAVLTSRIPGGEGGEVDDLFLVVVDLLAGTHRVVSGDLSLVITRQSWSPQGDALMAVGRHRPDANEPLSVFFVPADGAGPRTLVDGADDPSSSGQFSPDGHVIWVADQMNNEMLAVDRWGQEIRRVVLPSGRADSRLALTPDGRFAIMTLSTEPHGEVIGYDPFLVDLATGDGRRLSYEEDAAAEAATWPGLTYRIGGDDRIDTALALVRRVFDLADCVVLARADEFADALAAGPLAASMDAPLLLTSRDRLDDRVAAEIDRLQSTCAVLVGGTSALSEHVADALRDRGLSVDRIAGADRFEVAAAIAERVGTAAGAYLVEGISDDPNRGWPDAVAVAALAAREGRPILLTHQSTLPDATAREIRRLADDHVTIVGGVAAVGEAVEDAVRAAGATVSRIAGTDRYATSRMIADRSVAAGLAPARPLAVTGRAWPDALTAGVIGAASGSPVLLVDGDDPAGGAATHEWLRDRADDLETVRLVGGASAVAPTVATTLEGELRPIG